MAQIDFNRAAFMYSSPDLARCPPEAGREVAFAGRSNAGKSSAINALTGHNKLARVSKTPGRTQLINFFSLGGEDQRLVDLPGYGYAKVPLATKREWQTHLADYLQNRQCLAGLVLLMDVRHPFQDYDKALLDWGQSGDLALHVALTKADKLGRGAAKTALLGAGKTLRQLAPNSDVSCQLLSAHNGHGFDQLRERLSGWLTPAAPVHSPADTTDSAN